MLGNFEYYGTKSGVCLLYYCLYYSFAQGKYLLYRGTAITVDGTRQISRCVNNLYFHARSFIRGARIYAITLCVKVSMRQTRVVLCFTIIKMLFLGHRCDWC